MRILIYVLETIACSGLFMLMYRLLISRKASYLFCRRFLVWGLVLSAIIPMFNIPVYVGHGEPVPAVSYDAPVSAAESQPSGVPDEMFPEIQIPETAPAAAPVADNQMDWTKVLSYVYLLGLAVSLGSIVCSLFVIGGLKRRSRLSREKTYTLAENEEISSPFSFRRTVYLGTGYDEKEREQILSHELSHIRHRHSGEKIRMSVIRSFLWYNPVAWMMEKRLEEVQEWQADNDALSKGYDVEDYQNTIVRMLFGLNPAAASGFNSSFTKNRLLHMKTKEIMKSGKLMKFATLLMVTVCFVIFGCKPTPRAEGEKQNGGNISQWTNIWLRDNKLFIYADNIPDGIVSDSETCFHYSMSEEIRVDAFTRMGGIEIYYNPDNGKKFPCIIAVNGCKTLKSAKSAELDWVNEDTWIYIGNKKATYKEFKALKKSKYLGVAYYKARESGHPSLVYVADNLQNSDINNINVAIDYPGAGLPDVEEIVGLSTSEDRFMVQTDFGDVAEPDARFAIDGRLTDLESFNKSMWNLFIIRNDEAEKRFGPGVRAVAESLSDKYVVRAELKSDGEDIFVYINGQKSSYDELVSRIEESKGNCNEYVPKVYVVISDRTGGPRKYVYRIIEDIKLDSLENDDSVVFSVFHSSVGLTSVIDSSGVLHVYSQGGEEHFSVE